MLFLYQRILVTKHFLTDKSQSTEECQVEETQDTQYIVLLKIN